MERIREIDLKLLLHSDYFLLFIVALVYIVIISGLATMSHNSFYTNAWDLGIYAQALYSTLNHGKLLYYTVEAIGNPSRSLFGIHFAPFLFFLVPVYAIYQNPITLLVLRPTAISMGLIPLYLILRDSGITRKWFITYFAAIYLIYPPMLVPISNFDILSFLPVLFLFALYYLRRRKYARAYVFILLALMVNEFVSLIVAAMAIYVFLMDWRENLERLKRKRIGLSMFFSFILLLTGILWFTLASIVITYFNPAALTTKWEWGDLGSGPKEIIFNVLTNPIRALNALFNDGQRKFLYIVALLGPLSFLSLLEPLALIMALPWLAASLLSVNPLYYSIETQYPAFVSPFIFLSAVDGLKRLMRHNSEIMRHIIIAMTVILLVSTLLIPPGIYFRFNETNDAIWLALREIPPNASISVMPDVYPHVCNRLEVYPYFVEGVNYVLINVYSWWYNVTLPRPAHIAKRWCDVKVGDDYGIILNMRGVILYERGYNGSVRYFSGVRFNYGARDVAGFSGKIIQVENGSMIMEVLVHEMEDQSPLFFKTPLKYLPPGRYNITALFKAASLISGEAIRFEVKTKPGEIKLFVIGFSGADLSANVWKSLSFSFTIRDPMPIEIATYVSNSTNIYFKNLNITQVSGA